MRAAGLLCRLRGIGWAGVATAASGYHGYQWQANEYAHPGSLQPIVDAHADPSGKAAVSRVTRHGAI